MTYILKQTRYGVRQTYYGVPTDEEDEEDSVTCSSIDSSDNSSEDEIDNSVGSECPNCGKQPNPYCVLEDGLHYCDDCYESQKNWG